MKKIITVFLVMMLGLVTGQILACPAHAQFPSLSELQPLAYLQERDSLRNLYREQIQSYQVANRQYTLDKAQFKQLQTLASLDTLVGSTRSVMKRRAEVLITYLDLLHLELRYSPSADVELKQAILRQIESLREELQIESQLIIDSPDRDSLNERTENFPQLYNRIEELSYLVRLNILLGKMRYIYVISQDKFSILKDENQLENISAIKLSERQRAIREIEREYVGIDTQWQEVEQELARNQQKPKDLYLDLLPLISNIQSGVIRLFTLLGEVSRL